MARNWGQERNKNREKAGDIEMHRRDKASLFIPRCQYGVFSYLGSMLWAVLENRVENLHVVGVPGIGQLVKDHQLHHRAEVVFVCVQKLSGNQTQAQHS